MTDWINQLINKPMIQWTLKDFAHFNGVVFFFWFVYYLATKLKRLVVGCFKRNKSGE